MGRDSLDGPTKSGGVTRRFFDQPVPVRILRGTLLALFLAGLAYLTPTPYMLEAPGRTVAAGEMMRIEDRRAHPVHGRFLMTTVLAEPASVLLCIYGLLDPAATLTRRHGGKLGEHAQSPSDAGQMELSQVFSTRVALEALGFQVGGTFLGLRVLGLMPDSPNAGRLEAGDLLVSVQDRPRPSLYDLRQLLNSKTAQDTIASQVQRGDKKLDLRLALAEMGGQIRVGAMLRPEFSEIKLPVKVDFHSGNTSGASAGLVFALEIYDQLSPDDLARGRVIAATGTLDPRGRVGGIQGLSYKLVSVERAGAEIFLVPQENYEEIKTISSSVKIIPVSSFQEALDALDK